MKSTFKISLFACFMLVFASASFAQTQPAKGKAKPSPEMKAQKKAEREEFGKELGLNKDQEQKLKEINQRYRTEMQALRSTDQTARKAEMKKLHDAKQAEIKAVLSADQYAKWEAKKAEHKDDRKQNKKGGKGKKGPKGEKLGKGQRAPAETPVDEDKQ